MRQTERLPFHAYPILVVKYPGNVKPAINKPQYATHQYSFHSNYCPKIKMANPSGTMSATENDMFRSLAPLPI